MVKYDLPTATQLLRKLENDQTSFYIASTDYDMLSQVSRLINRNGLLSLTDTSGRVQYLVDGRHGSPLAARRIMDATQRLMRDQVLDPESMRPLIILGVDEILRRWQIPAHLRGFRYLRMLLQISVGNEQELRPIGKTMYPLIAQRFNVSYSQIERNIRYCLKNRTDDYAHLTNTQAIYALSDEISYWVAQVAKQTNLPIVAEASMGRFE
ncbi:MAG: sporulation initiation factor Spo0A C-terminal domain-containing protein [Eubacteriales bacterium]|nr:sporulation initiation factor Spo0A C-terminal domain-containing protein [Eubacteriales bacterium]